MDNEGFEFVSKKERCRSDVVNPDDNMVYSYYFYYNPHKNILRRVDYADKNNPEIYDKSFDISDTILFGAIKHYPNDFGGDKKFYILNLNEDNLKIFEMIINKYGISHYNIERKYQKNELINLPLTELSFLAEDEAATFLFYFNEYIAIN